MGHNPAKNEICKCDLVAGKEYLLEEYCGTETQTIQRLGEIIVSEEVKRVLASDSIIQRASKGCSGKLFREELSASRWLE
jgi:hypothetical protein